MLYATLLFLNAFLILTYYSMILSCSLKYFTLSFTKSWGSDPEKFFNEDFLNVSSSPFEFGGIVLSVLIGVALLWLVNWFICYKGIKMGIEKANKVLLPLLILIMIIIVIRGVTLEGATVGLNKLFTPNWSKMKDLDVWTSAYGQVFYSLSVGMGIMMTYSSYLPSKSDINNSAFMTGFANCGFEFLCAIGVFSILGFMATSQGVPVDKVVSNGISLAFVVFPKVFSIMGAWGNILGVLFFLCLTFAGLTSTVSLVEAVSAPIIDKTGWARRRVVTVICLAGFIISITFATNAGIYILDIVDSFINNYGVIVVGLLEAIVVGWIIKPSTIREHTNSVSYFRIGKWWDISIKFIIPIILATIIVSSLIAEFKAPYGGYDRIETVVYGWLLVGAGFILSFLICKKPWKNKKIEE